MEDNLDPILSITYEKLVTFGKHVHSIIKLVKRVQENPRNASLVENLREERLNAHNLFAELQSIFRKLNRKTSGFSADQKMQIKKLQTEFQKLARRFEEAESPSASAFVESRARENRKTVISITSDDYTGEQQRQEQESGKTGEISQQQLLQQEQQQKSFTARDEAEEMAADYKKLEDELVELVDLFQEFQRLVKQQQSSIDTIEDNTAKAEEDTRSAVIELGQAANYSSYSLPLMGAVVGGLVLGPVGAVVGMHKNKNKNKNKNKK
jgi:syntaxin 1B/2/3